jgi:hypothetical protein
VRFLISSEVCDVEEEEVEEEEEEREQRRSCTHKSKTTRSSA